MSDVHASDFTEGQQARKWWSDAGDLSLLTQVNIDLPFKQAKNAMKASGLDGKKASSRFYQLIRVHKKFQESSKYLSGVEQDETGKIILLDELVQLFDEACVQRQAERTSSAAKAAEKEAAAGFVRDQCCVDVAIFETQAREIALEQERLEFKKYKFEMELKEREMELKEREMDRLERIQQREDDRKRNDDMMQLICLTAN
ncbi:hypothetical protein H310_10037 [Aphanomyces invadans]|uniref:Uncharacterized protein n=1 Tax=Aphanomyces invadans TaxID=157072 RepID=A0A024TRD9_9STRA|nr:hypothetical protein H310_10037 [Aphanomyces invadans]ETV96720.1 hypothetical protein H310_10037 [Aphanomyces invadans]|eukprot:XP_008874497.1 hypothetical protein H310_10037 [Aphanomyces invadans]